MSIKSVSELEQERRELPARIREAAAAGDVKAVQQLQQRLDSLPLEIRGAYIMELQRQIDELEERKAEVAAKLPALKAAEQEAFDRKKAAEAAHLQAQAAYARLWGQLHTLTSQIGQLRVRLDQVLAETLAVGPVVRSAWQQR
ncbi:MAG: hypothetical protein ACUVX9_15040 [Anaerolineae bacterium]